MNNSLNGKILLTGIILATMASFMPVLFNDFSFDDRAFFIGNSFYYEERDVSALFTRRYTTSPAQLELFNLPNKGSGSVAYRPVLSMTYMADALVWGRNPFGFHLTNLIAHLVNVSLLFIVLSFLFSRPVAFWGALIFGVHPLNVETVASVGYRADLFAGMFVLLSFLFWMRYRRFGKRAALFVSGGAYFLGVFTKESVLLTPALFFIYDYCFGIDLKQRKCSPYLSFMAVAILYLYAYLYLFPNPALNRGFSWQSEKVWNIFLINGEILKMYISGFLCPWAVRIIPGIYYPLPGDSSVFSAVLSWGVLFFLIFWMLSNLLYKRKHVFILCWAFLFWLPVSNILPNPNPVAHRYLYLPLMGLSVLIPILLFKVIFSETLNRFFPNGRALFLSAFIAVCCLTTFFNAKLWFNDFTIASALVRYYPNHYKGHEALAMAYAQIGRLNDSAGHLEAAMRDPRMHDPAIPCSLANVYLKQGRYDKAYFHLRQVIALRPDYPGGYSGMADYYRRKNKGQLEALFLKKWSRLSGGGRF